MTALDLSHLTISEQVEWLYNEGVYLAKRKRFGQYILLYQFRTIYAEIHYLDYRKEVEKILYSNEVSMVEPYLEQINVDALKSY